MDPAADSDRIGAWTLATTAILRRASHTSIDTGVVEQEVEDVLQRFLEDRPGLCL